MPACHSERSCHSERQRRIPPGSNAAAPDLSLRTSPQAGVEWRPAAAGGGNRQGAISAAAPFLSLRASAHTGVAIRFLFYVSAGNELRRAKPIPLFVLPKRETAFDVKEKRAPVGKGEPKGGTGVAACGRTIRGAPAVRSAAARSGPVRFSPARPLRLGSVDARLLSHVILSVSEESPGQGQSLRTGNGGLLPPGAGEGRPGFPQRSKTRRMSVSPNGFSGTARWGSFDCAALRSG